MTSSETLVHTEKRVFQDPLPGHVHKCLVEFYATLWHSNYLMGSNQIIKFIVFSCGECGLTLFVK